MTSANHALTGAFIGLAVGIPWIAVPVAFVSHFICDVIPHYDVPGATNEKRLASRRFWQLQIILGGSLGVAVIAALAAIHRGQWLLAIICAAVAASPDILSLPRYISIKRTGHDIRERWWFWRFHHSIQWFQEPVGIIVEIAWAAAMVSFIAIYLS